MRRLLLFTVWSLAWISAQGQAVSLQHLFPVFDATNFAQKPDLSQYGLKRMPVVYPAYMWDSKEPSVQTSLPDRNRVNAFAQLAAQSSNIVVIDIEQWPLAGDPATVTASITKLQTVIRWFKTPVPSMKVGFYGFPPLRDYWDSIQEEGSARYKSWQTKNDALAPIAQLSDVLFPSLYTFYDGSDRLVKVCDRGDSGGTPVCRRKTGLRFPLAAIRGRRDSGQHLYAG